MTYQGQKPENKHAYRQNCNRKAYVISTGGLASTLSMLAWPGVITDEHHIRRWFGKNIQSSDICIIQYSGQSSLLCP